MNLVVPNKSWSNKIMTIITKQKHRTYRYLSVQTPLRAKMLQKILLR